MRPTLTIATFLAATIGLSACATTGGDAPLLAARADDSPIAAGRAVLTIHGMSCPLCAHNVDKSLLGVRGVKSVEVDMSTGIAMLELDPAAPPSRRDLAEAVDRSGFSLKSIEVR